MTFSRPVARQCRPAAGRGRHSGELAISKNLRCNEQIRISPIRLIDETGGETFTGIVDVKEAQMRARNSGLDLVEVDPNSRPPVCRIMDYGKWKYAQRKKEQKSKSHRRETELKEIRIKTPKIGDHDLSIKVNHARAFLERGDRVQFMLRYRGRELAHVDEGRKIFAQIQQDLADLAKVEQSVRYEGKRITMMLAPSGKKPGSPASKETPRPAAGKPAGPAPGSSSPAPTADNSPAPAPAAQAVPAATPENAAS